MITQKKPDHSWSFDIFYMHCQFRDITTCSDQEYRLISIVCRFHKSLLMLIIFLKKNKKKFVTKKKN